MESLFGNIYATLQDMQMDTRALAHDMDMMRARVHHMDESLTTLMGTFASIEKIFVEHSRQLAEHDSRLSALERDRERPPAA